MGLFGSIIKKAVGEGISNAVGKAVENAVKPAAEKFAGNMADQFNTAADSLENTAEAQKDDRNGFDRLEAAAQRYAEAAGAAAWNQYLGAFPKWEFSPVTDSSTEEADEYFIVSVTVSATQPMLNQYRDILTANGFTGGDQIKRKVIDGVEHCVDFTFAEPTDECEIRYAFANK